MHALKIKLSGHLNHPLLGLSMLGVTFALSVGYQIRLPRLDIQELAGLQSTVESSRDTANFEQAKQQLQLELEHAANESTIYLKDVNWEDQVDPRKTPGLGSPDQELADLEKSQSQLRKQIEKEARELTAGKRPTDENDVASSELRALVKFYSDEVDALKAQLGHQETPTNDLADLNDLLGERDKDIRDLLIQQQKLMEQIDKESARLARLQRFGSRLASDDSQPDDQSNVPVGWFAPSDSDRRVMVLIRQSRVHIMEPPYCNVTQQGDEQCRTPKDDGMSVGDAVAPGSALLQIAGHDAYVFAVVNSDSFSSFRALRDCLRREGVEVGWNPDDASVITLAPNGRSTGPQVTSP